MQFLLKILKNLKCDKITLVLIFMPDTTRSRLKIILIVLFWKLWPKYLIIFKDEWSCFLTLNLFEESYLQKQYTHVFEHWKTVKILLHTDNISKRCYIAPLDGANKAK